MITVPGPAPPRNPPRRNPQPGSRGPSARPQSEQSYCGHSHAAAVTFVVVLAAAVVSSKQSRPFGCPIFGAVLSRLRWECIPSPCQLLLLPLPFPFCLSSRRDPLLSLLLPLLAFPYSLFFLSSPKHPNYNAINKIHMRSSSTQSAIIDSRSKKAPAKAGAFSLTPINLLERRFYP